MELLEREGKVLIEEQSGVLERNREKLEDNRGIEETDLREER